LSKQREIALGKNNFPPILRKGFDSGRKEREGRREGGRKELQLGLVTHTCNFTYLGGRDQEDCNSRPPHLNKQAKCGGLCLWSRL
jgi:hypothetical protein